MAAERLKFMKNNTPPKLITDILEHLVSTNYIQSTDVPNINLYMDQVTTFMEEELSYSKREDSDKILTKTMINNYAKNSLLPSPEKKKYSREQILILILIYYLKNVLAIRDIDRVLALVTSKHYHSESNLNMAEIYDEIIKTEKNAKDSWHQSVLDTWEQSSKPFESVGEEDSKDLQLFSFICAVSLDIFNKKLLLEKLIDQLPSD